MNLLGEPHRNMTKRLLDPLAKHFLVSGIPSLVRPLAVTLSLNPQRNLLTVSIKLFLLIVCIARVAKHFTTGWQIQMHHLQSRYIHIRTGQNKKLHRLLVTGGDQLDAKAEKKATFRRYSSPILFALNQTRAADTTGWPEPCCRKQPLETNQSDTLHSD